MFGDLQSSMHIAAVLPAVACLLPCSFLPQAGDGADYLEGYKDPYHVCFKCGKAGHWAQACTGLLPDGQVSHIWTSNVS